VSIFGCWLGLELTAEAQRAQRDEEVAAMPLEALISIAPPPENPSDPGKGKDWTEIETSLGTALPTDYKEFIDLFGTGELAGSIWVYNPFAVDQERNANNLLVRVREVLNIWRSRRTRTGDEGYPYTLYPEPSGLLPWGHVDTGDELFWQTSGDPEQWVVVVSEARGPGFERFEASMTGFLASRFSGKFKSEILPRSLQKRKTKVTFTPLRT
jgi:hypothetical protein